MEEELKRIRIETQALVVGYAMSRLDQVYLKNRKLFSWQAAYTETASLLPHPINSFKNLRDEFDPLHENMRQGWHRRPLRPNRQRVVDELADVSDEALIEMVRHILRGNEEELAEALDALAVVTRRPANVAERLLTGRRAEEFFQDQCFPIVGYSFSQLLDRRDSACDFDFSIANNEHIGIEVKGLKHEKGDILFTDREWREAHLRRQNYLLVVVGNLESTPCAKLFADPYQTVRTKCIVETRITPTWRATISTAD